MVPECSYLCRLLFSRAEIAVAAIAEELKFVQAPPDPLAGIAWHSAYAHRQQNQLHRSPTGGLTRR